LGRLPCGDEAIAQGGWPEWPGYALIEDVRALARRELMAGRHCALATLVASDGPSPRPCGAQMLVMAHGEIAGCVSGGCIEAAVAEQARACIHDGRARLLSYGEGSPWLDLRLSCGSRIEIAVERLSPEDTVARAFADSVALRSVVRWESGLAPQPRRCRPRDEAAPHRPFSVRAGLEDGRWWVDLIPLLRLLIVGGDAVAVSLAQMAQASGIEVVLARPNGPSTAPPVQNIAYWRCAPDLAMSRYAADDWSAVVCTTHDLEMDEQALVPALHSSAFYIGALGSRRKRSERQQRLRALGFTDARISALRAPVGLDIGAATPAEIAVSILAEIIAARRGKLSRSG
jgi:xanthine dehydrogenase accessory factor